MFNIGMITKERLQSIDYQILTKNELKSQFGFEKPSEWLDSFFNL